jgi:hypothetical protein
MIGFIDTLYTVLGTRGNYSAIADLHTLQFNVTHALGFSVFISRILATDLSESHCHFKSHMECSFHSLIPFLPFFLNHLRLPSPELDPIHFQAHIPAGWRRNSTLLDYRSVKVKVNVTLRLTFSQSVSKSWYRAPSGAIFITV